MAIPTYDKFIEPILRYLAKHPAGSAASTVHEASSAALGLVTKTSGYFYPAALSLYIRTVLDGLMTD